MSDRAEEIRKSYGMELLEEEHTYLCEVYRSPLLTPEGLPALTTTYGLYCRGSYSRFHRLSREEVWSFYEGDPIRLTLLYPDGTAREVVLGPDRDAAYQFTIPAGVWQGGCLDGEGSYALYGCTVAPGFTPDCYTGADPEELIARYPQMEPVIRKLT